MAMDPRSCTNTTWVYRNSLGLYERTEKTNDRQFINYSSFEHLAHFFTVIETNKILKSVHSPYTPTWHDVVMRDKFR